MNEGKDKLQLEEVRNHATELKKLINQLSEGILSPLSSDENEWTQEELLVNMRQLLEQQEKRKEQPESQPPTILYCRLPMKPFFAKYCNI